MRRRGKRSGGEAALPERILAFLGAHTVMSLATQLRAAPHAVSLMYANDGFALYWVSDPGSRHSRALAESPAVSVTIAAQFADFQEIVGLQARGTACRLEDPTESDAGMALLAARYPFLRQFTSGPRRLVRSLQLASVYRFDPEEITLIDNARGFGHKDTYLPPPPS